eukprot:1144884-Pelagomonas_calceolata.AAC.3
MEAVNHLLDETVAWVLGTQFFCQGQEQLPVCDQNKLVRTQPLVLSVLISVLYPRAGKYQASQISVAADQYV